MSNLPVPARSAGGGGAQNAVKAYLAKNTTLLSGLLPQGMDEKRMARIAIQCFREIPKLANCSPDSLIGGILASAQVGLPIGKGAGGYAYLIPYSGEATFVIGVPGRIALAYRSGQVKAARCGIVYADMSFEADPVTGLFTIGMQDPDKNYDNEPGQWYWASVETAAGGLVADYFNRPTVESRRAKLQSRNSPAWRDHFDEMATNMILRYVLKRVPKSAEQERAETLDSRVVRPGDGSLVAEWVEGGEQGEAVIDVQANEPEPPKKPPSGDLALPIEVALKEAGKFTAAGKKEATKRMRKAGIVTGQEHWYDATGVPFDAAKDALGDLLVAGEGDQ